MLVTSTRCFYSYVTSIYCKTLTVFEKHIINDTVEIARAAVAVLGNVLLHKNGASIMYACREKHFAYNFLSRTLLNVSINDVRWYLHT